MNNTEKNILIVEDDDLLRDMHVMIFEDEGYQVDAATDGKKALDLLAQKKYDLICTDMFMPEMNGFDLIIQCQALYPETKIILISGGGRDLEAEPGKGHIKYQDKEIDIDMYFKKPFDLDKILSTVEDLLQ